MGYVPGPAFQAMLTRFGRRPTGGFRSTPGKRQSHFVKATILSQEDWPIARMWHSDWHVLLICKCIYLLIIYGTNLRFELEIGYNLSVND